jgi:hypothetical protein
MERATDHRQTSLSPSTAATNCPVTSRLETGRASVIFGHVPLLRPAQKETSLRAGIGAIVPLQGGVKTLPAFAEHPRR